MRSYSGLVASPLSPELLSPDIPVGRIIGIYECFWLNKKKLASVFIQEGQGSMQLSIALAVCACVCTLVYTGVSVCHCRVEELTPWSLCELRGVPCLQLDGVQSWCHVSSPGTWAVRCLWSQSTEVEDA